jgi:hypothetical protein
VYNHNPEEKLGVTKKNNGPNAIKKAADNPEEVTAGTRLIDR